MEGEITVEAVYRQEPDIRSGVLALLAYAQQMQEAEAEPTTTESVEVTETEADNG